MVSESGLEEVRTCGFVTIDQADPFQVSINELLIALGPVGVVPVFGVDIDAPVAMQKA